MLNNTVPAFLFIFFLNICASSYALGNEINALNHNALSSPWAGTVKWVKGNLPTNITVTSQNSGATKLHVRINVGQNQCYIEAQEIERYSNGTVALKPTNDTCGTGATVMSMVPVNKTNVGIMMMTQVALIGQAELKPSVEGQKLALDRQKPSENRPKATSNLPRSLSNYHFVTASGAVYKIDAKGADITYKVLLQDQWMQDAGIKVGDIAAKGKYFSSLNQLTFSEKIKILPDLRQAYQHCGPIYTRPSVYSLSTIKSQKAEASKTEMFSLNPKDSKFCASPRTSRTSCRVVGCGEYLAYSEKKSIILQNEDMAIKLGKASRATYKSDTSYAEALSNLKAKNYGTKVTKGSPGYFERGGACGPLSCEQEDTLQFLVDEYW